MTRTASTSYCQVWASYSARAASAYAVTTSTVTQVCPNTVPTLSRTSSSLRSMHLFSVLLQGTLRQGVEARLSSKPFKQAAATRACIASQRYSMS